MDTSFINYKISELYNVCRYGLNGHMIHDDKGYVLAVFNRYNCDYTNWLLAVDYGKENTNLIHK